MTESEDRIS